MDQEEAIGMSFNGIAEEQQKKLQFKQNFPKLHKFEKAVIDQYVDKYTNKFVKKLGYRKASWLPLVYILVAFMIVLNIFACYARPDFLTTLVCALAILFLNDTDNVDRDMFRWVPLLQLLSIAFDCLWLFWLQELAREGVSSEGQAEAPVKSFSLTMSYVAFIFKFFVFLVLWKVSYNYLIDIKGIVDAPRVIKLQKIERMFSPNADGMLNEL